MTIAEVDHYAQDIKQSVELYYQLFDPESSSFSDKEKLLLQRLSRIKRFDARLLSMIAISITKEVERRTALLETIERFGFPVNLKPYHFRELQLDQLAIKLKAGDLTIEEITRIIKSVCDKFVTSAEFHDAIKTIGKNDGYYGWEGLRYFLFEYEQHLRYKSKTSRQILDWETFQREDYDTDHKSIEHVYPQKASDAYWKEAFSKYSVPERNTLRNSVGNLLPISTPKNSSLSNKSFPAKCGSIQNQVGYKYGCLAEVQVGQQSNWSAIHIAARGLDLLKFMEDRWGFSLGNTDNKLKILGIDFVLSKEGITETILIEKYNSAIPKFTES